MLFLTYISDLAGICKKSTPIVFADDTAIIGRSKNGHLNMVLRAVSNWMSANHLMLNSGTTKIISFSKCHLLMNKKFL